MTAPVSPVVRRVATAAFVGYLVVLAAVAFLPLPAMQSWGGRDVAVNLSLSRPDLLGSWESERNVLMTIPFGVLLPLVVRWRYEWMVAACVGVTLVVESGQLLGSLAVGWAWRAFDVDDLFLNTVGGFLGLGVTGALLAALHLRRSGRPHPRRLPPLRLVTGAFATGVVAWAVVATLTTPRAELPVYACDVPPLDVVTELPGGATAYAGPDGSLCVRTPDGSTSSLPSDVGPGPVITYESAAGAFEVGVAGPRGAADDAVPVAGSELLLQETRLT